jgi:hypothetical protein
MARKKISVREKRFIKLLKYFHEPDADPSSAVKIT